MPKTVGLPRASLKMLEFLPFPKDVPNPTFLYRQAIGFFDVFEAVFGDGHQLVLDKFYVPIMNLSPCLVIYHFAVELMLKALISLVDNEVDLRKKPYSHNLAELLKKAANHHKNLVKITENESYNFLIQELSDNFAKMRYSEGTLFLRHNKEEGAYKKPLQELSEALYDIFNILIVTFEAAKNPS